MCFVLRYDQNHAQLVGPFTGGPSEAAAWATSPANNPNQDPSWTVIGNSNITLVDPMAFATLQEVFYFQEVTTIYGATNG